MVLLDIVLAITAISLASFAGLVLLFKKNYEPLLLPLVSFSTGTFLGVAFLDLFPEAVELGESHAVFLAGLLGMLVFFALEKIILWHHHHSHGHTEEKPMGYLNLVGDAFHNFLDGAVIAATFITNPALGWTTAIAVALHEIPQEIGDFSLLLYSGFSYQKALLYNFLSALVAVAGGLTFYYLSSLFQGIEPLGLGFTAGMFLYIAGADLFPELHKERSAKGAVIQLTLILLGVALIYAVSLASSH